ncbi:MAG: helix-turn-helix domain-containing protein, partial [candidate division WOR-3 bacterium]|nr:helix-turn-helix domain-containing protein [candidate division WOR-3 bacterium]
MRVALATKLKAIEEYLKEKKLKSVAQKYGIHYATLSRWIKKYSENGIMYNRPWNRLPSWIEERLMLLKEAHPDMTLEQAQRRFLDNGINLSLKAIHDTWNRYGLVKRLVDDPFSFFVPDTAETKTSLEYIRYLLKDKSYSNLKKAAKILNSLPGIPLHQEDILEKIPENLLSLRRKFDRLYTQFLKISTPEFYRKIHRLRLKMEKKGLRYSAIVAGLSEILALHWMRTPKKEIELNEHLKRLKGNLREPVLNFQLTFLEATARIELMEIDTAKRLTQKALRLLRHLPYASFYESIGDLMTFMSDYRLALNYHLKALEMAKEEEMKNRLYFKIALSLVIDGRHREAIKYLNMAKIDYKNKYYESYNLAYALANLGLGRIEKSLYYLEKTLEKSEKEQFRNTIFTTICCYGAINCALGKQEEARKLLQYYLKLIKKYGLNREADIMENLINPDSLPLPLNRVPTGHLVYLLKLAKKSMKIGDYKRAWNYAQKYGIRGFFHRCLLYLPEPAQNMLNMGKNPALPRSFLQLPLFNTETPVYYIKFLGEFILYKNQKRMRIKLKPREIVFSIFLGLKASEPEKGIAIDEIYNNFWSRSKNPDDRFSHLLVAMKKKLMLPKHFLVMRSQANFRVLINKGFYINTDYGDFTSALARAKALERAGEWEFARKEYLWAFKLFRGEPFKKNFDNWSVDMRFKILTQFETEAINFAKSCIEHGNKADARKILQKVLKIIPDSEEAKRLLDGLIAM